MRRDNDWVKAAAADMFEAVCTMELPAGNHSDKEEAAALMLVACFILSKNLSATTSTFAAANLLNAHLADADVPWRITRLPETTS